MDARTARRGPGGGPEGARRGRPKRGGRGDYAQGRFYDVRRAPLNESTVQGNKRGEGDGEGEARDATEGTASYAAVLHTQSWMHIFRVGPT